VARGRGEGDGRAGAAEVAESRALLAAALRRRRRRLDVTQVRLAALLGSSQSRVAKMEAADPTVSLELLVRALVALGATRRAVGRIVADGDSSHDRRR
jgi:transcriptional regulator with XRE-family HTH domain